MPVVNWKELMTQADEGAKEFALLEPNMYAFVIKDAAKVGTTSKDNVKFTINPSVESGERANARVFHDFNVSESAYAMKNFFFGDLAILGLGVSFFDTNPTDPQIAQALQGRRFTAEVFHEEGNNGKTYAKLRNFAAPTSAAPSAGVPGGLPSVAQAAPIAAPQAAPVASDSPWATPAAPSVTPNNTVLMPPAFG